MFTPVPFYFLRHGETDWNKLRLMQGQTDTALNTIGIFQAEAAAQFLAKRKIATIATSPLRRAKHTTDIIAKQLPNAKVVTLDDLKESNFGSYEGHPSGAWREEWIRGGEIPGGEYYADFLERCLSGINKALENPGPVLIISHGGVFSAVNKWALDNAGIRAGNCELLALAPPKSAEEGWKLRRLFTPEGLDTAVV
ncbi:MAG: histidine phosphatase family protein [Rhodospirillaceae bacterium]|nr:histidine phosphatase family protein [Rhodospirillaceae bacterium]